MSRARQAAVAVAALRVAYGAALLITPSRTTKRWLGPDGQRAGGGQVAIRALGAREVAIHAGALAAAVAGAPVRPWLAASMAGDCADIASTFGAKPALPDGSPLATLAVAGGSAALTAAVAAGLDS
jgi:hypothetical protein